MGRSPEWMADVPCLGATDLFFPTSGAPRSVYDRAEAVCAGCAHRVPCLEMAVADPSLTGIWAGTTWRERVRIRQERRRPPVLAPTPLGVVVQLAEARDRMRRAS